MNIQPTSAAALAQASSEPKAAPVSKQGAVASAAPAVAANVSTSGAATPIALISPQQVSPTVLQMASGDGDGRSGMAALNDGDAAAQMAAQAARSGQTIDFKA